jgi:hypothetical protein
MLMTSLLLAKPKTQNAPPSPLREMTVGRPCPYISGTTAAKYERKSALDHPGSGKIRSLTQA